ncbi:SDR family oxidoreductase [Chitinophaga sp. Hz27]|uniref:SDR family oxidoreductase n=1 Tax=Chitinophaga sp. Hz27 TaxID=3347169 RepID=UPI0035DDB998
MILVTGANGHFGGITIDELLQKGVNAASIAALVRSEEKGQALRAKGIQVRIGDYNDPASLQTAFQGVEKLLLVSGTELAQRSQQQENVVHAAKKAGVHHIVYTSVERKSEGSDSPIAFIADSHLHTEKAILASGIPYTILRNNLYLDYLPALLGSKVTETGVRVPVLKSGAGMALRSDMAAAAANVLIQEGHLNKSYHISADPVTYEEIAVFISETIGKTITATAVTLNEYIQLLVAGGFPEDHATGFSGFAVAIGNGELLAENPDLERILGRKPVSAKEFITTVYSKL